MKALFEAAKRAAAQVALLPDDVRAAALRADNVAAPTVLGEAVRQARGKGKGRVAPAELVVVIGRSVKLKVLAGTVSSP